MRHVLAIAICDITNNKHQVTIELSEITCDGSVTDEAKFTALKAHPDFLALVDDEDEVKESVLAIDTQIEAGEEIDLNGFLSELLDQDFVVNMETSAI